MPRMTNAARSARSREALLQAAAECFDELGFAGTSMNEIVERASMTKGGAYFHFASKEALALAVIEEQYAQWPDMVQEVRDSGGRNLDQVVELSYRVARAFRDDVLTRAGVRLMNERRLIGSDVPTPFTAWMGLARELLIRAEAAGELAADLDVDAMARFLVAGFYGVQAMSDAMGGRRDIESLLDEMWLLLLPRIRAGRE